MTEMIPYIMAVLGFLIVFVLNGIKSEIKEVKGSLQALEKDLRDGVASLDRRVSIIEARCEDRHLHPVEKL